MDQSLHTYTEFNMQTGKIVNYITAQPHQVHSQSNTLIFEGMYLTDVYMLDLETLQPTFRPAIFEDELIRLKRNEEYSHPLPDGTVIRRRDPLNDRWDEVIEMDNSLDLVAEEPGEFKIDVWPQWPYQRQTLIFRVR